MPKFLKLSPPPSSTIIRYSKILGAPAHSVSGKEHIKNNCNHGIMLNKMADDMDASVDEAAKQTQDCGVVVENDKREETATRGENDLKKTVDENMDTTADFEDSEVSKCCKFID